MTELLFAIGIMLVAVVLLKVRNDAKLRALSNMTEAVDVMFDKLETLIDAKSSYDDDVPDAILEISTWMVQSSRLRGIEFALALSLSRPIRQRSSDGNPLPPAINAMREPLQEVFAELVHAWITYISNKNLFARLLIRNAIGRLVEKDDHFTQYIAQIVQSVAQRKAHPLPA